MALAATEVVLLKFFHEYPETEAPPSVAASAEALVSAVSTAVAVLPPAPPSVRQEAAVGVADGSSAQATAPTKLLHNIPVLASWADSKNRDMRSRLQEVEVCRLYMLWNTFVRYNLILLSERLI